MRKAGECCVGKLSATRTCAHIQENVAAHHAPIAGALASLEHSGSGLRKERQDESGERSDARREHYE